MKEILIAIMAMAPILSHGDSSKELVAILAPLDLLHASGIKILAHDQNANVGYARVNSMEQDRLSRTSHLRGRCGAFERLTEADGPPQKIFSKLRRLDQKNKRYLRSAARIRDLARNPKIEAALAQVNEGNLKDSVSWLSSFPSRFERGAFANDHVLALRDRLEVLASQAKFPVKVELINHHLTHQNSLRVHIEGRQRPQEIVVLGGHLDSINLDSEDARAPGADDNASGSSNLVEALRILVTQDRPDRSVEFYWYASEETGLIGSGEIARQYRAENKNVIGVFQLDMTLFPGDGEFILGSMSDYTNAWLRDYLHELNRIYVKAKVLDDQCGYACSDHASWHRQGFPAVMPSEAVYASSNSNIHTSYDVIDRQSDFRHSAIFSKLALAFAMDLANSTLHSP